jgi:hypothetical protein
MSQLGYAQVLWTLHEQIGFIVTNQNDNQNFDRGSSFHTSRPQTLSDSKGSIALGWIDAMRTRVPLFELRTRTVKVAFGKDLILPVHRTHKGWRYRLGQIPHHFREGSAVRRQFSEMGSGAADSCWAGG